MLFFISNDIKIVVLKNWNSICLNKEVIQQKYTYCISFTWKDFVLINRSGVNTIFYAVHYQAFINAKNKSKYFPLLKYIFRKIYIELMNNHQLIVMDEQTLNNTNSYYHYQFSSIPIVRVSVDPVCVSHDCASVFNRNRRQAWIW